MTWNPRYVPSVGLMKKTELDNLLNMPAGKRKLIIAQLNMGERNALNNYIDYHVNNPFLKYEGDPIRFVEKGLKETLWSKQGEILESLVHNRRTTVPACHAPGKTHIAARAIAYWGSVYPPGTARVIVTSMSGNQVKNVMWPHIRRLVTQHKLPGYTNSESWRIGEPPDPVALGIKPPDGDEAGIHGHHAPNMLVVVDEAGGIKDAFGRSLEALMTGGNTRMLVIGNPPTDDEDTWFERICGNDTMYHNIPISAFDTPNFTGEYSGICRTCPPELGEHEVATHLINRDFVEQDIAEQYGTDSAMYIAKVLAQFPRNNTAKTLPISWLEAASKVTDHPEPGRIKLGVDVASDGGDEFVIAKLDGWRATIAYSNAGTGNEDAVQVAGKVLEHIQEAEKIHAERGITEPVRVKLDAIGVGWGIVSLLKNWGAKNGEEEAKHHAQIVGVNVAMGARDSEKFLNQRSEMWWGMRDLIHPDSDGNTTIWLDVDHKVLAQLNGPMYTTNAAGRTVIEKKADMKKRGTKSPDRAEAILLAAFEPHKEHKAVMPVQIEQPNQWGDAFAAFNS